MRIRRLDIVGFKSFMDRTVVAFDEGVTGVVGPNGCGKSNVADAIRWVLGEQSARHLRGRSMEDVIFNGSESKPPLSMAEVMLTFENDRPSELPSQYQGFSELTVGRRLFRTGESEYLVNGVEARLLDVNDIFFGSGVGRTAYSIIEQGRIGQIVSARPEDRRAIIEEAAGITKYKKRREAAERKMEATQQNLVRVADIVQELGKQLESLNRQARKAEKYKALRAQIRELGSAPPPLATSSSPPPAAPPRTGTRRSRPRRRRRRAPRGARRRARRRPRAARRERGPRHRASPRRSTRSRARRGSPRCRSRRPRAARSDRRADARAGRRGGDAEGAGGGARRGARDPPAAARRPPVARLDRRDAARGRRGALRDAGREQGALQSEADRARAAAAAALSEATSHKSQLAQIERQRLDLRTRIQKNRGEADEQAQRASQLDGSRSRFVEKLGQTRQLKLRLDEQRGAQEEMLERTRAEFIQRGPAHHDP